MSKNNHQENSINQSEKQYTNKQTIEKAKQLVIPIEQESKKKKEWLLNNAATILSVGAIGATVILFRFNVGYCKVYNIPVSAKALNLESYVPCCAQIIALLHVFALYLTEIRKDNIFQRNRINWLRAFYGACIILTIITSNRIHKFYPAWLCVLFSVAFPLALEIALLFRKRPRKDKSYSGQEYIMHVENHIHNRILYNALISNGLVLVILALIVSSDLGNIYATTKIDYQTFQSNEQTYAIIVENNDMCLAQLAKQDGDCLYIFNDSYQYFEKQGLHISYRSYNNVCISKNEESNPNTLIESDTTNSD